MAAKPMSKTKVVSHIAEKTNIPKKTAALFFRTLQARGEGMQGRRRQVCDSESRPRSESAPQGAHGPQPANRRGHQDQGQDGSSFARGEGVQRRHLEVVFAEEKL